MILRMELSQVWPTPSLPLATIFSNMVETPDRRPVVCMSEYRYEGEYECGCVCVDVCYVVRVVGVFGIPPHSKKKKIEIKK